MIKVETFWDRFYGTAHPLTPIFGTMVLHMKCHGSAVIKPNIASFADSKNACSNDVGFHHYGI